MAHGPIIEINQQVRDRSIEIRQAEEAPIAQTRQDPALYYQHSALDLSFVAWSPAPGWQDRRIVMLGHRCKGRAERGLEP